jgi:carboxymethylenebutenolidase
MSGHPSPTPVWVRWLGRGLATLAAFALLTAAAARAGVPAEGQERQPTFHEVAGPAGEFLFLPALVLLGMLVAHVVGASGPAEAASHQGSATTSRPRNPRDASPGFGALRTAVARRRSARATPPGPCRPRGVRGEWTCGRAFAALALLALLGTPALAEPVKADTEAKPEVRHFTSGGKEIAAEYFAPAGGGKHPVLVALHAVDGVQGPLVPMYHDAARACAGQGYVVLLVHYFDRTGAAKKDVEGYRELFVNYFRRKEHTAEQLKRIKELSGQWTAVVRDAVAYARGLDNVDSERIGLVGFSLGATVALAAAAEHDLKAAALVEMFGTLPRGSRAGLKKLPPTLVIHGEEDTIIPVDEAYCLIGLLAARRQPCEAEVYPGVGHMFSPEGRAVQEAPLLAAKLRAMAFLDKHLKPRVATTAGK